VIIQQTGPSLSRQLQTQYRDFEEDSHDIIFICNIEEGISLLTYPRNFFKKGEGQIHVLLLCIQLIRIEHSGWIATAISIVEKIYRKQE